MLNLNLPDWFYVFFGYTAAAIIIGTAKFLYGGWGVAGVFIFFALIQIGYRLKTGRWCDWDEALK